MRSRKGKPDSTVLEIASQEGRTFVTLDQGFADIRRYPPSDYFGVIVLRLGRQDKYHVLSHFEQIVPLFEQQALRSGCLWIVEESQVRIRS